jgi:glycosyltransferase involved in cell wall biosynthesis
MKILFFLESLHAGGKERRAAELMNYLVRSGDNYDIELVLTEREIHYDEVIKAGIKITVLKREGSKYDPGVFYRFYKICRRFNPDIIHSWGKMATFYAIPAKLLCGVPLISNLIADTIKGYGKHSRYAYLLKTNVFFSDRVLANSGAGLKTYNLDIPKARVIYNGVRLSRFKEEFDKLSVLKELGAENRGFIVVMVASFSTFKDYDLFIETAKETGARRKDVTFVAVGDGPEFSRIQERLKTEMVRNVILTGRQKHVERIVSASDIGLLCTHSEGISNSIIEYMALGKPAIVSDTTGGSHELIVEGVTGYCTKRNAVIIADHIIKLIDDPELRETMGANGKKRIETEFSIDRMGEEFRNLYDEVLSVKDSKRAALYEMKEL